MRRIAPARLSALSLSLLLVACAAPQPPTAFVRPYTRIVDAAHPGVGDARARQLRAAAWARVAVAQARAGNAAAARRLFERAIDEAPGQAWLYNDLGYLELLAGDAAGAQRALQQALRIDPTYARAAANLRAAREALARSAPTTRAAPVAARAPALAGATTPAAANAAPAAAVQAAPATAPAVTPAVAPAITPAITPAVTPAVAPLAAPVLAPAVAPGSATAAAAQRAPCIEVSNGNGVPGMAARVAAELAGAGLPVRRLSNRKPYTQRVSRIAYRAGWRAEALRLRAALPGSVIVEPAHAPLRRDIDLRLLLGAD